MGLTSDSETESMTMKSKIDEMNVQAIIIDKDKNIVTQIDDNDKNVEHSSKTNLEHKCTFAGCGKSFDKPSRLTWHLRQHTGERPYKCNFENCDKSYTNSSHLRRHQKAHETLHESVVCGICHLTLKNRFNLLKHHRRAHENKNRLICETCNISFRKKYKYDEHMSRFHHGKLFKCSKCDRELKNLVKLKRHEKMHDVRHECPEQNCKMVFNSYMELRIHAKVHPKEYICGKCQKKFSFINQYNRHMRTHEEKLLACPYDDCDKTYFHSNQLKTHIRTKHENPQFECDFCKNKFSYKAVLSKHIQIIHLNIQLNKPRAYKKGEEREIRRDAGKQTRSMVSVLTGIFLPPEIEKSIINRDPELKLSDTNFEVIETE